MRVTQTEGREVRILTNESFAKRFLREEEVREEIKALQHGFPKVGKKIYRRRACYVTMLKT